MTTLLLAMGCQTTKIPNVKFFAEIPFKDCPEGVYVESLTKKVGFIECKEWSEMRPYMIMVDPEGKKQIFNQWSEACRWSDPEKCNVELDSVKTTVQKLDALAEIISKGKP